MVTHGLRFSSLSFIVIVGLFLTGISPAHAVSGLAAAQKEVDRLRTLAATKFESANALKYQIGNLQSEQLKLRKTEVLAKGKVDSVQTQVVRIALERYRGSGFGNGFDLLFSKNPALYLRDAASLDVISRNYQTKIQHLKTYKQELQASQFVLQDRTRQLQMAQQSLSIEVLSAQRDLVNAEKVLSALSIRDRRRLANAESAAQSRNLLESKKLAKSYLGGSSRGAIALRFALKKLGDIYVWGGAGPTRWDCSGLTLRAFASVGVSLPHSAAIQFNYGKSIGFNQVQPGDLLFYGTPISHVSIYMGGGRMVQAPRPGKKVEIVPFVRMFGYKPFIGAKRI
jgi:cell wall-associated NlpC family hydrolase